MIHKTIIVTNIYNRTYSVRVIKPLQPHLNLLNLGQRRSELKKFEKMGFIFLLVSMHNFSFSDTIINIIKS